ncbi:hypothetical protein [Micromonospora sp. CPCC 206061]|uniref:hypothetical protein n=1 Tax=Micromonospora sp. CPCC 206061 TaxID=3122410 RepID=UPI002FF13E58
MVGQPQPELLVDLGAVGGVGLAQHGQVQPRQTINQACRKLEIAGTLRRYVGPAGKIVNDLRIRDTVASADSELVTEELLPEPPAGDSAVQRYAEAVMLRLIGGRLGVNLSPRRFVLSEGVRVEVDGADDGPTVLVEAWAHQGPPKPAQKNKVLADALRRSY